ncbi:hypothetical protein GOBAR_AA20387 [Gossypium barbadense]|uniref:Uncharacterized protein n=1 Tax=Gossypium barbadense TaxID=3634 RepID=A0A2P5XAB6_GOSBA|nr:hypothetical protein GOBAR_AA20387 [Gossypium barbadense]
MDNKQLNYMALKNQQASIQGLETQIGQLSKLISKRLQGSLPSNTEPNPREQLNAINVQDEEGFVEPEPELRQETVVSRGQGELTLRAGDETITLQARNSSNTSEIEGDRLTHSTKTDNMVQPTLQEMSLKEAHESFSSNSRGPVHEDRRLQIEELDEWRTHKPRTHDKPKLCQDELNTFPNQLKVGDRVLLDAADPHIVTTTPNEEIPSTVISIFPFARIRSINSSNHHDHSTERFSTETRPRARACLGQCENRATIFPNIAYDKTRVPRDVAVVELAKTTQACRGEPVKTTRTYDIPVSSTRGQTC